ncbi:MAG: transcriptional repressor [Clostridia bacterium]|nr:transcriptional repressor [Clostridia bacterium]
MSLYDTQQKRILMQYLKMNCECAYTIKELWESMKKDSSLIFLPALSTVYRIMPALVEEGLVKRFVKDHGRQFVYQMVCGDHCEKHIHLKCIKCGKLLHMEDAESSSIADQVMQKHGFTMDQAETVIFGLCDHCK